MGDVYTIPRYFQEDGNPVVLKVLRRETVTVPAGTFNTVVVQPMIQTDGLFGKGGEAEVYFTDDTRRMLVQLRSKVPVVGLAEPVPEQLPRAGRRSPHAVASNPEPAASVTENGRPARRTAGGGPLARAHRAGGHAAQQGAGGAVRRPAARRGGGAELRPPSWPLSRACCRPSRCSRWWTRWPRRWSGACGGVDARRPRGEDRDRSAAGEPDGPRRGHATWRRTARPRSTTTRWRAGAAPARTWRRGSRDGSFGMADETGRDMNRAFRRGMERGLGDGRGRWRAILSARDDLAYPGALRCSCSPAGAASPSPSTRRSARRSSTSTPPPTARRSATPGHRDFRRLAAGLPALDDGGVVMNVGSAVIMPEVFLKALTVARNLGAGRPRGFTACDLDMQRHYRPRVNVVERPTRSGGGSGYQITGPHELLMPLLAWALAERLPLRSQLQQLRAVEAAAAEKCSACGAARQHAQRASASPRRGCGRSPRRRRGRASPATTSAGTRTRPSSGSGLSREPAIQVRNTRPSPARR